MEFIMNEHFATAVVPICSALFSTVVAIVVPLCTKWHERKMQADRIKHELYGAKRLEYIEAFVRHVCFTASVAPSKYISDDSCHLIRAYIDKSLHHYIDDITANLSAKNYNRASDILNELCSMLQGYKC